jgi:hypothetical protein
MLDQQATRFQQMTVHNVHAQLSEQIDAAKGMLKPHPAAARSFDDSEALDG